MWSKERHDAAPGPDCRKEQQGACKGKERKKQIATREGYIVKDF